MWSHPEGFNRAVGERDGGKRRVNKALQTWLFPSISLFVPDATHAHAHMHIHTGPGKTLGADLQHSRLEWAIIVAGWFYWSVKRPPSLRLGAGRADQLPRARACHRGVKCAGPSRGSQGAGATLGLGSRDECHRTGYPVRFTELWEPAGWWGFLFCFFSRACFW